MNTGDRDCGLEPLVGVAEASLRAALTGRGRWRPDPADVPPALRRPGAAFVTLRRDGRLLGCVGVMEPTGPLVEVVADRARAAAFEDPRFPGITPDDFEHLDLEVSVLSPLEPFGVDGYRALVEHLDTHRSGVLVEAGRHRATFLPDVWEQLPDAATFVAELWRKAGMRPGDWPEGIRLFRYTTTAVHGAPPRRLAG